MNYLEAINYIHDTEKFGSKLGLDSIQNLLSRLGNPQQRLKVIHIAGTNGKGSVTSMISHILHASGYNVGMFVSPYLQRFTERIQVNLQEINSEDLGHYTGLVKEQVDKMLDEGMDHPTEFEIVTAVGFLYFAAKQVDFAVVEVGLGGRYDATNVVDPIISVITSISYDHMQILGDTLSKIAFEKGGIIKRDRPVVSYPQDQEALNVLKSLAIEKDAAFYEVCPQQVKTKQAMPFMQTFDFNYKSWSLTDIKIHLCGRHQNLNAATALTAILQLHEMGYTIKEHAIYTGMSNTKWPGRMEKVHERPTVIIDGAHNVSGAQALAATIKEHYHDKKINLLLGVFKDKDVKGVVREICPVADKVFVTKSDSDRSISPEELKEIVSEYHKEIIVSAGLEEAISKAMAETGVEDIIVITGSLYLVGRAREIFLAHQ